MYMQTSESSTNNSNELLYSIAFSMLKHFSENEKLKMLRFYKSAEAIYKIDVKNKVDWPLKEAALELTFNDKHRIQCFTILDKQYPERLSHISDPPLVLYSKGSDHFSLPHLISIVGTRQHTFQAKKIIQEIIEGLQHLKIGVISGLALGVDALAHESSLALGIPTWGVLAHGLDTIYPNQHRGLAIKMLQSNGGLITECRQKTPSMPYQFPKRNRIVAGMSDATIVIESKESGGSMITAKLARSYDREVFAVPGKIHDEKSKGCLWLIQHNIATMYYDPIQLLENMQWPLKIAETTPFVQPKQMMLSLDPVQLSILNMIQEKGALHKDLLAMALQISTHELSNHLLRMELNGYLHLQVGNIYSIA